MSVGRPSAGERKSTGLVPLIIEEEEAGRPVAAAEPGVRLASDHHVRLPLAIGNGQPKRSILLDDVDALDGDLLESRTLGLPLERGDCERGSERHGEYRVTFHPAEFATKRVIHSCTLSRSEIHGALT